MKYIVNTMDGLRHEITEQEYLNLKGKEGLVFIPSTGRTFNLNSVVSIIAEADAQENKNTEGVLHDGLAVVKHFGQWYVKGEMTEKNGQLVPSQIVDPTYYKEVARDCVPSSEEYEMKYRGLPREKRLELILETSDERGRRREEAYKKLKEREEAQLLGTTQPERGFSKLKDAIKVRYNN